MIWRSVFLFSVIVLVAVSAFKLVVQHEVERVVSVHVTDKAVHLLDMLVADAPDFDALRAASMSDAFTSMARASNVTAVHLYGPDGAPFVGDVPNKSQDGAHQHQNHQAGEHAPAGHDGLIAPEPHVHHHHGHTVDADLLQQLAEVDRPETAMFQSLIDGGSRPVVLNGQLAMPDGSIEPYGQIILPAYSTTDRRLGFVAFTMSVRHIFAAMSQGAEMYGIAFSLIGAVLFGVPAAAFWLQRRLAERSARDAGFLSRHDALTGLLNRQTFTAEADQKLYDHKVGYVGYVDADRFKLINDTYGHSVGDAFLKHIAALLRSTLGEQALVARFGGDEFTFALEQEDSAQSASKVEQLRRDAAQEVEIDGFLITSSISVGIAESQPEDVLEDILQRADTALYFAKSQGRNRIALFDEKMGEAALKRRKLEAQLRRTCASGGFQLAFQPLVDARSETTLGYEALLRLEDEDGAAIPPSEFVPLAEEIGLIEEIGKWVLFNAMQQISAYDDVSSVSINLSAEQFKSGRLVGAVASALEASGLSPQRLELEITESVLLEHDIQVEYQIDALKEMGISIAMDDFGTGFSSLSTLWRYGVDRIKIDKSFVQALNEAPERSLQLIDAIILLGGRMGMSITAEGIETEDQRDMLTKLGCDVLQGFHYGKPLPLGRPRKDAQRQVPS